MTECVLLLAFRVLGNQYVNLPPSFQIILESQQAPPVEREAHSREGVALGVRQGPKHLGSHAPPRFVNELCSKVYL